MSSTPKMEYVGPGQFIKAPLSAKEEIASYQKVINQLIDSLAAKHPVTDGLPLILDSDTRTVMGKMIGFYADKIYGLMQSVDSLSSISNCVLNGCAQGRLTGCYCHVKCSKQIPGCTFEGRTETTAAEEKQREDISNVLLEDMIWEHILGLREELATAKAEYKAGIIANKDIERIEQDIERRDIELRKKLLNRYRLPAEDKQSTPKGIDHLIDLIQVRNVAETTPFVFVKKEDNKYKPSYLMPDGSLKERNVEVYDTWSKAGVEHLLYHYDNRYNDFTIKFRK